MSTSAPEHSQAAPAPGSVPGDPTPPLGSLGGTAPRPALRRRVRGGTGRRARLEIHHFDTLSVLKFSAVWSVAVMIVTFVAVTLLYGVLASVGVISAIEDALVEVTADSEGNSSISGLFDFPTVLGFSLLASLVFVICMTGVLTLTAILYNAAADLMGGIGVTLTDKA